MHTPRLHYRQPMISNARRWNQLYPIDWPLMTTCGLAWHGMHYSQPIIQQRPPKCVLDILSINVEHPMIHAEVMARPVGCWNYYI
jgi:hypothetical protein